MNMSQLDSQGQLVEERIGTGRYALVIYDNDHVARDLVVCLLMLHTACSYEEAEIETWEAEQYGKAAVHFGTQAECQEIGGHFLEAGVAVSVEPEWGDK